MVNLEVVQDGGGAGGVVARLASSAVSAKNAEVLETGEAVFGACPAFGEWLAPRLAGDALGALRYAPSSMVSRCPASWAAMVSRKTTMLLRLPVQASPTATTRRSRAGKVNWAFTLRR
ncbi:hypothetical protein [Streptomyces sp. NPDC056323]|uniref:hypothetical protein n=1 Tax=Streptomyces sp. NPDC056323 TaxID=3345784 RepID=UPI0035DA67C6